jgi:hypothetical protein
MAGKKLLSKREAANAGNNNFSVDIRTLSAGTYIIKINCDDKAIIKKLVKE